ncbi:unnamed protein product [Parascedosporium putredinis]|uniref:tRNA (uracil-O(2)-)-methyltransferase n=1 Tax=Parascedosporium putredinis TaxID=1442378 RepID=A0A9P1M7U5_9PEZI|nr:unnamed protein product [Parascedosporium putredinis]CAI7988048.1 unnamed protein product [Parascedosporium putredinis]
MVAFTPRHYEPDENPAIHDVNGNIWTPVVEHVCSFNPDAFFTVMSRFVLNPNYNSSWLFRADILSEEVGRIPQISSGGQDLVFGSTFEGFRLEKGLIRRLIPRNPNRDDPLEQTCLFFKADHADGRVRSMVVYFPHISLPEEAPFYHPQVRGVAHLHEWDDSASSGVVSVHLWHFDNDELRASNKVQRTALMLLQHLHKHGQGTVTGYVKRVPNPDSIISRERLQDRHTQLRTKYAKDLINTWAEQTDPSKHVFEDIGIAAFLIELWEDMYKEKEFPDFVDIGCGNGLLVYILRKEGYSGWGFDARSRKSWAQYNLPTDSAGAPSTGGAKDSLQARVLLPKFAMPHAGDEGAEDGKFTDPGALHDGVFPRGTFIVSNHADELTPWTPILAAHSDCPFIMIPCCSHNLSGAKFRAPPPKGAANGTSAYASLVAWASKLAEECLYEVESVVLRIPSTRNTAILGRKRTGETDLEPIISKYGGTAGYYENVSKLLKTGPRGH